MIRYLTKQFGLVILGLGLIVISNSVDEFTKALHGNTAQVANAVTCRGDDRALGLAAAIDERMLATFNGRRK